MVPVTRRRHMQVRYLTMLCVACLANVPAGCARQQPTIPLMDPAQTAAEIRKILPQLEKGHSDKLQLAWYISWFRSVNSPIAHFSQSMARHEGALQKQLQAWAHRHGVSLAYHYGHGVAGQAQKAMDHEQGNIVRSDSNAAFQRDFLVLMFTDYDWQEHLAAALIPYAKNHPQLERYLHAAVAYHKRGVKQLRFLLSKYHYVR